MSDHRQEPATSETARSSRLLVVLALTVALVGPALATGDGRSPSFPDPSTDEAATTAVETPGMVTPGNDAVTTSAGDSPVAGDVLQIPAINLEAPLVDVTLGSSGVLAPPSDTDLVGRWNDSAKVGSSQGQSVLTGHTVSSGGGVMNRLGELGIGDRVRATDDGAIVDYVVTSVKKYSRAEIAQSAQQLFGQDQPTNRLVLVTCADFSSDEVYLSNIVVIARPVRTV